MGVSSFPCRQWVMVVRRGCEGCVWFKGFVWLGENRKIKCEHINAGLLAYELSGSKLDACLSSGCGFMEPIESSADTQGRLFG
mgnify:CR=1 FL=1